MTLTNTQLLLSQATNRLSTEAEQSTFRDLAQAKIDLEGWNNMPRRTLNENSQRAATKLRVKMITSVLVKANLPLVIKVAKYFNQPGVDEELLVSEGLLKLLQCIDAFKVEYGFKFSTYLQRPLYRHFSRVIKKETKRNWGRTDSETVFKTQVIADESHEADELIEVLKSNKAGLDAMEKTILLHSYGIGQPGPKTLKQLSAHFRLSQGRLKRTMARATDKLRNVLIVEDTNVSE